MWPVSTVEGECLLIPIPFVLLQAHSASRGGGDVTSTIEAKDEEIERYPSPLTPYLFPISLPPPLSLLREVLSIYVVFLSRQW